MWLLLLSAVGIPVTALTFFALLEGAFTRQSVWTILIESGIDLCNLSIGIVGGLFLDARLEQRLGQKAAPILAIFLVLLNMVLAAIVMVVKRRTPSLAASDRAYISIFLGVFAVAVPSVMIIWLGEV